MTKQAQTSAEPKAAQYRICDAGGWYIDTYGIVGNTRRPSRAMTWTKREAAERWLDRHSSLERKGFAIQRVDAEGWWRMTNAGHWVLEAA